jgi:spermidine synthase
MHEFEFIKNASVQQIKEIVDLYMAEGWWKESVDTEALVRGIISGSHCFLISVENGHITGMGRAISDGFSDAYIQDVTVALSCRGRGTGAEIIKRITERLYSDGIRWVGLIAEKNSHGFYEKLGFSVMQGCVPMLKL